MLKKLPRVERAQLGNPTAGTTRYDVCVYDDALRLVGSLTVDRAGQTCPQKACWRPIASTGYRYADRAGGADGVTSLVAKGGPAGKGKIVVMARNNARKGQTSMPLGIAAALQATRSVTVQTVTSDGACFGSTLTNVRTARPTLFRAK